MSTNTHRLEPAFYFDEDEASVLLHQGQVEISIEGIKHTGEGEVRLDLLPEANIYVYGHFQGVSADILLETYMGQREISSLSINKHKIDGYMLSPEGDVITQPSNIKIKWLPKSEPIIGLGDKSVRTNRVVFHLFNFVDLIGTRRSSEQSGTVMHAIEHVDLICDEWEVELKSLVSTRANMGLLKEKRVRNILCKLHYRG